MNTEQSTKQQPGEATLDYYKRLVSDAYDLALPPVWSAQFANTEGRRRRARAKLRELLGG